jgi:hypothetical protein
MTAMVTLQLLAEPVLNKRSGAVWAVKPIPAGTAKRQRCVPSPVEKEQSLIASG